MIACRTMNHLMCAGALVAATAAGTQAHAVNVLTNPGFEDDDASGGDVFGATGWGPFNDAFTTNTLANTGSQSFKTFGPFFNGGGAGIAQSTPASPGETWQASAFAQNNSGDAITGGNFAIVKIEFLDAGSTVIPGSEVESQQINAGSTQDSWIELSTGPAVAPAGTAFAQIVLVHVQVNEPVTGGAVFFDDAVLELASTFDPADLDQDGDVDDGNFGIAFAAFTGPGQGPSSNPAADLDNDGDVDDGDFGIAFAAFTGPGGVAAAVPEPTSLALLGLGGLLVARRRR